MISVPVHNQSGAEVGKYEFNADDLAPGINKQLLHDVVVMYEANRRQGTVRTKSRGMVAGSTRKLYRQKGTGRARAGASRTPVRRGGGHTFGKKVRDFSYRLPKKAVNYIQTGHPQWVEGFYGAGAPKESDAKFNTFKEINKLLKLKPIKWLSSKPVRKKK